MHDPVMALKTSLVGSINVLEVAKRMRARIVHASSSKVYGLIQSGPVPEEFRGNVNPVGEHSAYEEGKRAAESLFTAYHNQYGVDTRIARLFNVYGPRMALNDGKVISGFIRNALYGENITIRGNGTQTRCFLYIDDAVEALVRMMGTDGNLSKPINIGGIDPMRIDALAEDVVNLTGSSSKTVRLNLTADSVQHAIPDIRYARQRLGWEPLVPIEEGLVRTNQIFQKRDEVREKTVPVHELGRNDVGFRYERQRGVPATIPELPVHFTSVPVFRNRKTSTSACSSILFAVGLPRPCRRRYRSGSAPAGRIPARPATSRRT